MFPGAGRGRKAPGTTTVTKRPRGKATTYRKPTGRALEAKELNDQYEAKFGEKFQKLTGARAKVDTIPIMKQAIREGNPWPQKRKPSDGATSEKIKAARKAYKSQMAQTTIGVKVGKKVLPKAPVKKEIESPEERMEDLVLDKHPVPP